MTDDTQTLEQAALAGGAAAVAAAPGGVITAVEAGVEAAASTAAPLLEARVAALEAGHGALAHGIDFIMSLLGRLFPSEVARPPSGAP